MGCRRVDAYHVRRLSTSELVQTFARFCIPQLHVAIVTRRYELCTSRVEVDVIDRLGVPREGS